MVWGFGSISNYASIMGSIIALQNRELSIIESSIIAHKQKHNGPRPIHVTERNG